MTENSKKIVVVAGGTGGIGSHIVDGIVATQKYIVKVFTRQDPSSLPDLIAKAVDIVKVDYSDHQSLVHELQGVHTVIVCLIGIDESAMQSQLNLLDACLEAKVKRFAPSEWSGESDENTPIQLFRKIKIPVRHKVKESGIEYTLFMTGLFMDYFALPQRSSMSLAPFIIGIDFNKGEANIVGTGDEPFCVTRADDVGKFVAAALDLKKWDERLGMVGSRTTWNELIKLGEQVRKKKFDVKYMSVEETLKQCDSNPINKMGSFLQEAFVALAQGELDFKATLNEKCPDIKPMTIEEFLIKWWGNKEGQCF